MNEKMYEIMRDGRGFIAALDQSGGSSAKTLKNYGIDESEYSSEEEMFNLIHEMRKRVMTSKVFTNEHILGTILFEKTMMSEVNGKFTADYLWNEKGIVSFLKVDKGLAEEKNGVKLMKEIPNLKEEIEEASQKHVFGTKMRSVIYEANEEGIRDIVNQQFEFAKTICDGGLVPIIKPEENNKFRKKENAKKQYGSKSERPEKHICPPGECDLAKKCGGCQYQGMDYEKQLNKKHREVKELLGSFGKVEPVIGMQEPFHYRNKVNATFQRLKNGTVISGAYQQGTHSVVKIDECQIEDKIADGIIYDIRGMLRSFKIKVYDEDSGYGLLRHVLVRRGFRTGEVMVVLVLASPILPSKNNFVKALREKHPEVTTVVVNVNDRRTSVVLGERNITIYGKGFIEDELCGLRFRISPSSFYQINPVQTEILYGKAIEFAGLTGKEKVIDAYCGIGTIGMAAAGKAGSVIGVEVNRDAVRDAITNAKRNNMKNITFYNEDAGEFMVKMAAQGKTADVVFMDPPRAGSDEAFLSSLLQLSPKRVVYISCNPVTQARDLKYLISHGYRVERCQPVDMFPWTYHIEVVCVLSKLKSGHHISTEVN